MHVLSGCVVLKRPLAAFQVKSQHLQGQDDPRHIVAQVTHGPTFVFPGKFSVAFNTSFIASHMSQPSLLETIIKNITDGVMDGFKAMLPAHHGPVYSVSTGTDFKHQFPVGAEIQYLVESSAFLVSLNTTAPATASFDVNAWTNHAINFFRSQAASSEIRELLSNANFMVRSD